MRLTGLWSMPLSMRAKVMRERRQQVHMSSSGACVVVVHICAASATVTRVRGVKPSLCTSLHQVVVQAGVRGVFKWTLVPVA